MGVRPGARLAKIAGRTHTSHWRSPLISFVIRRFRNELSLPALTLGDTCSISTSRLWTESEPRSFTVICPQFSYSLEDSSRRVEAWRQFASWRRPASFFWFINLRWSAVDLDAPLRWIWQGDGPICSERWHRRGLQVLQNSRLVEIVDEQELAATPRGTRGVLVTDFYNGVWLLLRYDTGALAEGLRDGSAALWHASV